MEQSEKKKRNAILFKNIVAAIIEKGRREI
jgi:hypothetical protein